MANFLTATFAAADGSTKAATFPLPPVFDPAWVVAGGAVRPRPPRFQGTSRRPATPASGVANGSRTAPYSAAQVFGGVLGQPYALIATMPPYYNNAAKASFKGGSATSPIQPGHGIVLIADPVTGNTGFGNLTLQAEFGAVTAPGLSEQRRELHLDHAGPRGHAVDVSTLIAGEGWVFYGLNFVSDQADMPQTDRVFNQMVLEGPLQNIVVANCSFAPRTPFSSLTPTQAIASAPVYGTSKLRGQLRGHTGCGYAVHHLRKQYILQYSKRHRLRRYAGQRWPQRPE